MALKSSSAPYVRGRKTTLQIMVELGIGLALVWLFGIIYSFVAGGAYYGLKAIFNMVVAVVVGEVCDVLTALCRHKKGASRKEEILHLLSHNYSWISSMILVLTLPAWTPMYVVILGSVFATLVVKNFFGGFGKNIFNPAALARIFILVCFQSLISSSASGIEGIAGGTVTTVVNNSYSWVPYANVFPEGYNVWTVLSGTYFGALGETPTILILVVGVVLAIRKDINWRTPAFYLGTVLVSALLVALVFHINVFEYGVASIAIGGVAFGAVFMLTDPVTGPTSNFGKAFMGVFAGFMTMVIRYSGGSYPEGVIFSIALANMVSPVIDYFTKGKSSSNLPVKYAMVFGGMAFSMVVTLLIAGFTIGWDNTPSHRTSVVNENETHIVCEVEENVLPYVVEVK